jgi:hypothetical protein
VTYDGQVFDRKLTKAEVQRLLPIYMQFIAARAKSVPSPADQYALNSIRMDASLPKIGARIPNPVPGKPDIEGQSVYPIQTIKEGIEYSLNELKNVTDDERVRSTTDILNDFKQNNSKITCELGYSSVGRFDDRRIVKCEDNRSIAEDPNSDDEGYADVRTFILSIDPASLSPIGVLELNIFQAG